MTLLISSHPLYKSVESKLACFLSQHPSKTKLLVALSGGADSMVLLHLCQAFCQSHLLEMKALYVHHGLSINADAWQAHAQHSCSSLNIPFYAEAVHVVEKARHSIEEQARIARYAAFEKHSDETTIILLGHHANDQLETVLLRLQRGAGSLGLAGMAESRLLGNGALCFRPLLESTRKEIDAFVETFQIQHIEDESNFDDKYARNFLRNNVIPLWERLQPGLLRAITRSAALLRDQQNLLDEYTELDLRAALDNGTLCLNTVRGMSVSRQRNVLRAFIRLGQLPMPSFAILEQIRLQAVSSKDDAQIDIQLKGMFVKRYRDKLYLVKPSKQYSNQPLELGLQIDLGAMILEQVHTTKGLRLPHEDETISVRFNCPLVRIHLSHKPGSNTIKHWLKDAKIPSWERGNIPVIFYNDTPVQIVGVGIAHSHLVDNGIRWQLSPKSHEALAK